MNTAVNEERRRRKSLNAATYTSDRPTLHPWRWSQDVTEITFLNYPYHSESIYVNYFSKAI